MVCYTEAKSQREMMLWVVFLLLTYIINLDKWWWFNLLVVVAHFQRDEFVVCSSVPLRRPHKERPSAGARRTSQSRRTSWRRCHASKVSQVSCLLLSNPICACNTLHVVQMWLALSHTRLLSLLWIPYIVAVITKPHYCMWQDIEKAAETVYYTARWRSCGTAYCNRSCLWVCGCVCLWVCYHDNSKLRASILTKLGL